MKERRKKYDPRKDTRYNKKCEYLKGLGFKQSKSGQLWFSGDRVLKDVTVKRKDISIGAIQGMLSALAMGNKRKRKVKIVPYSLAHIFKGKPKDALFNRIPGSFESGK